MTAPTVAQYLAALPADRRAALSAARKVINENLPTAVSEKSMLHQKQVRSPIRRALRSCLSRRAIDGKL
jgi:hypothetical protein